MTRYNAVDGYYQLTGTAGQFVSNKLSDQTATAFFSNAGPSTTTSSSIIHRVGLGGVRLLHHPKRICACIRPDAQQRACKQQGRPDAAGCTCGGFVLSACMHTKITDSSISEEYREKRVHPS